tara:strand:+ start:867 stop:1826 length:960 start_codon:yes stop_codon:yes gene_type:complete
MQKILIYEYITGGGLINEDLTSNLMHEATLITKSLYRSGENSRYFDCHYLLDYRLKNLHKDNSIIIRKQDDLYNTNFLRKYNYVLPVMPESNLKLYDYAKFLEANKINMLLSDSKTIKICSDKYEFFKFISNNKLNTIKTYLKHTKNMYGKKFVIKDRYGVGCSYVKVTKDINKLTIINSNNIIQDYIVGQDYSVSVFFTRHDFKLLTINKQLIRINQNGQMYLSGIMVNIKDDRYIKIINIISKIKNILPGLRGFVGIDLLINDKEIFIIEINPRLTTSFIGVYDTLGINIIDLIINSRYIKNTISGKKIFLNTYEEK